MGETESPRMEHLSGECATPAIDLIAEQRMAEMLEMHADLVSAPGVQRALHQRAFGQFAQDPIARLRRTAPISGQYRHLLPLHGMAADRRLNHAAHPSKFSRHQSEVN